MTLPNVSVETALKIVLFITSLTLIGFGSVPKVVQSHVQLEVDLIVE